MALNMADIFEHAADAFPERVALIYGDRQVTYRELEDEANRLAHHLAAQGVGPGGHVGLYARNSVEAVATLLAAIKLRAVAININFRYLAERARVSPARLRPVRARPRPGPGAGRGRRGVTRAAAACRSAETTARRSRPRRQRVTSARAAPTTSTSSTPAGTTGHPKGVMWRHEDIWRTLGGGIDFVTGETAGRRVVAVPHGRRGRRHGPDGPRAAHPRRRHGRHAGLPVRRGHGRDHAEVRSARGLGGGAAAPGQRAVDHRRRDGAAADGGAGRGRLRHVLAHLRQLHRRAVLARGQGRVRQGAAQRVHQRGDRLDRDRLRRHRVRQRGRRAPGRSHRQRRARRDRDRRGRPRVRSRADRQAGARRARTARLLQGPGQDGRDVHRGERQALRGARRLGAGRGGRRDHHARPGQHLREHRRREGLPGGGRGRAEVAPRRVRRAGPRRARRPPRPAGGRAGPAPPRRRRRPGRAAGARARPAGRLQGAAHASGSSTRSAAPCRARPTTAGRGGTSPSIRPPPRPRQRGRPGTRARAPIVRRAARHRAPDRRVHPVRARRRRDQPGRRAGRARLRPVQRPGRAGRRAGLDGREHRRPALRRGRGHARPGARRGRRQRTWKS